MQPQSLARIERPARVLLGWLTAEEAARHQTGYGIRPPRAEGAAVAESARNAVASRAPGIDQSGVIADPPKNLEKHIQELKDAAAAYFADGWRVAITDLAKVCALQPMIYVDHAKTRTEAASPEDLQSIAAITLPTTAPPELPFQFDEAHQTWVTSSPNPNLKIVGRFAAQPQPGISGIGFAVSVMPSFVQVAHYHRRHILRDGYHRALGLLSRGITQVPALVRDFPDFAGLGLQASGLLPQNAYLGDRPPLLSDYLDDSVSAEVSIPATQKMIIIHGIELNPLT